MLFWLKSTKLTLKKHTESTIRKMAIRRAPYSRLFFLPNALRTDIDKNAPNTARQLIKIGNAF